MQCLKINIVITQLTDNCSNLPLKV